MLCSCPKLSISTLLRGSPALKEAVSPAHSPCAGAHLLFLGQCPWALHYLPSASSLYPLDSWECLLFQDVWATTTVRLSFGARAVLHRARG